MLPLMLFLGVVTNGKKKKKNSETFTRKRISTQTILVKLATNVLNSPVALGRPQNPDTPYNRGHA